jgi:hypothetical protein
VVLTEKGGVMRRYARIGAVMVCSCLLPWPAAAQGTPISEILVQLIQADIRLATPPPGTPFASHDAHFIPGEQEQLVPYLFNQSILSQLTTFPLGSSSGGFSYSLDPALGTWTRSTNSFGPAFAERALTIGRRKVNFGFNYQHSTYDTFEGQSLDDGSIKFYLTHKPVVEGGIFFEGDVIQTALRLDLSTNTVALFANYGVTNKLDVGVAVPIVSVDMDAKIDATVMRLATGPTSTIHQFPNGTEQETFSDAGSAKGIGDIVLRGKYRFFESRTQGWAAGVDLRLPTGDETNLLGTGATQTTLLLIGSSNYDKFAPHFNLGYTFTGESVSPFFNLSDEFHYTIGTEFVGTPKLTVTADLLGRSLRGAGRLQEQPRTFHFVSAPPASVPGSTTVDELAFQEGSLNLLIGAAGVKYNVVGNLLISANVLFPLTKTGIRDSVTPVIGLDYAF